MSKRLHLLLPLLLLPLLGMAQLWNGRDTLYGNEWIRYDQPYFKIPVAADGVYRIPYAALQAAGIPVGEVASGRYQLWRLGEETALYTPAAPEAPLGAGDYLEFYGRQNRSELDRYLFRDPDAEMLNPAYSLFTDTAAYFLTIAPPGTPGRRYQELPNELGNVPEAEGWYWAKQIENFFNAYIKKQDASDIRQSFFDEGEGFARGFAQDFTLNIKLNQVAVGVDSVNVDVRLASRFTQHQLQIKFNDQIVVTDTYFGHKVRNYSWRSLVDQTSPTLKFQFTGLAGTGDRHALANIVFRYPHVFNFEGKKIYPFALAPGASRKYIEVTNFNSAGAAPVIYDILNSERLVGQVESGVVRVAFPAAEKGRELIMVNSVSGFTPVSTLTRMDWMDFRQQDAEYIIISNSRLFNGGTGVNYVNEYAAYRSTPEGGGYTTIVIDVQQLYDQFAYGIARHSLAIRDFSHFIRRYWKQPKYIFLIGKGVEYPSARTAANLKTNWQYFFVPTFGAPGSDNLLVAGNTSFEPLFAVGRLAAVSSDDVRIYLDKVKAFEANRQLPQTVADRSWMKRIIHLGGGTNPGEQDLFRRYLSDLESIARQNTFGAEVFSFFKTSADPIQQSKSKQILDLINTGVSVISFFGHSGSNTFDFSLDTPGSYENTGKYPMMISMGCYSGQIHGTERGISERFIFQEGKGAIAFLASTYLAYASALRVFNGEYYGQWGGKSYGQGIGDALKHTIRELEANNNIGVTELNQQFTLHGDPAIVLNAQPGPDYVVDYQSVTFEPKKLAVELDSFSLSFAVLNLGQFVRDSITVEVTQQFPTKGEVVVVREKIPAPAARTSLTYRLPTFGEQTIGLNTFLIKVDADQNVAELPSPAAENNNELISENGSVGVNVFVFSNDVRPVYPTDMAIVSDPDLTLKASTANSFAALRTYILQVDTTEHFDSPALRETRLEQIGGVLSWKPGLDWRDGKVYYWRVSPDSIDAAGYAWRGASFTFLREGGKGWSQSHAGQWRRNQFLNMEVSTPSGKLKYLDDVKNVGIITGVFPIIRPEVSVDNRPFRYIPWDNPVRGGIQLTVMEPHSIEPWINIPVSPTGLDAGQYGSDVPFWVQDYGAFPYSTRNFETRKAAMTFLDSIVPPGYYVALITVQETNFTYQPEAWAQDSVLNNGQNLFNLLEKQGARLIREAVANGAQPYYLLYKKDDPSFEPVEGFAPPDQITSRNIGLAGSWDNGSMTSSRIGPAASWISFDWSVSQREIPQDSIALEIWGVKPDSTQELLLRETPASTLDLSSIDAATYPFLRLRFFSSDTTNRTTPQVDYWRVRYEGGPEIALNPAGYFEFQADTIPRGAGLRLKLGIENIGDYDVDSLSVRYTLTGNGSETDYSRGIGPLALKDSTVVDFQLDTEPLSGRYQLKVEAIPVAQYRVEPFQFNNLGAVDFFVERENRNPLLDVTFDGQHILNGDIVSAKPRITIRLVDDNPNLLLDDTAYFKVLLKYPGQPDLTPVPFQGDQLVFYPAVDGKRNTATIEFSPHFMQDGLYELFVQAEDASGNASGKYDYHITFQVFTKSMISNVFNYPNPFSTSTQFVYTLTGDQPPAYFTIQILTISGRVVRELTPADLGPLQIGTHRTEFAWDGTDEYGDRLANGVYLYRVMVKDENGQNLEKFDNGTDAFFKNNIGKLVILR